MWASGEGLPGPMDESGSCSAAGFLRNLSLSSGLQLLPTEDGETLCPAHFTGKERNLRLNKHLPYA